MQKPKKRKGNNKEYEEHLLNIHIADPNNACIDKEDKPMRRKQAQVAIEKFNRKYDSDLPDPRDQKFYTDRRRDIQNLTPKCKQ